MTFSSHRASVAVLTAALVLVALPAAADRPEEVDPVIESFVDTNPCTGLEDELTVVFTPFDHLHSNNAVIRDLDRHGYTSSGFIMHHGVYLERHTKGGFILKLRDTWRNPESGEAFRAVFNLRFVGQSPEVDHFELKCLTGPTIGG